MVWEQDFLASVDYVHTHRLALYITHYTYLAPKGLSSKVGDSKNMGIQCFDEAIA